MEDYPYKNKSLTGKVASDLILELFDGQTDVPIPRSQINEKVLGLHISRGGVSSPNAHATIGTGLDRLKKEDKAYNEPPGFWHINSAGVDTDSQEYKRYKDRLSRKCSK